MPRQSSTAEPRAPSPNPVRMGEMGEQSEPGGGLKSSAVGPGRRPDLSAPPSDQHPGPEEQPGGVESIVCGSAAIHAVHRGNPRV